jgi:hypothetical protein
MIKYHLKNLQVAFEEVFAHSSYIALAIPSPHLAADEIGMKEKIKAEIERHKKFQSGLLGVKGNNINVADIDIRNYAKYILREGTIFEKRELLGCLKSKLTVANKILKLV